MRRLSLAGLPVRPACDCGGVFQLLRAAAGVFAHCTSCERARRVASHVVATGQGDPHVFIYLAETPAWAA